MTKCLLTLRFAVRQYLTVHSKFLAHMISQLPAKTGSLEKSALVGRRYNPPLASEERCKVGVLAPTLGSEPDFQRRSPTLGDFHRGK